MLAATWGRIPQVRVPAIAQLPWAGRAKNLAILIALSFSLSACQNASPVVRTPGLGEKVDAYLQPFLDAGSFSGAVLIARGGRILHSAAYGFADQDAKTPNTTRTRFRIASISKTFTAAAILLLQEKGALSVHDPLSRFVPGYPSGEKITIDHLLTHRTGIPNINNFPGYDRLSESRHMLPEIISFFKDKPLRFEPGSRYEYSNSNYNLLAWIIERASGLSYGEYLAKNIFRPLGMKATAHADDDATISGLALGYTPEGAWALRRAPDLNWSIKTGNGSIYSTVGDLYRWDRALHDGRILSRASLQETFRDHGDGIGYPWFLGDRSGRRAARYNGRSPGYTSYLERYLDDDSCIIILSNNYAPVPHTAIDGLRAILFAEPYAPLALDKTFKPDEESLKAFAGRYRFGRDFYRPNAEAELRLKDGDLEFVWSETSRSVLRPVAPAVFLDRLFWATVLLQTDAARNVTGLIWRDTKDYSAARVR